MSLSNPVAQAELERARKVLRPYLRGRECFDAFEVLLHEVARLLESEQYFREEAGLKDAEARDARRVAAGG